MLRDRWTPLVVRELMVGASGFNVLIGGSPERVAPCSRNGYASWSDAGW